MADEPDNIILLGDLRATQNAHSAHFEQSEMRLTDIEKQLDDDHKIFRYSSGQSPQTQLRQARQESRIDAAFGKLEKPLSDKMPV
jgi:hypothetical protein